MIKTSLIKFKTLKVDLGQSQCAAWRAQHSQSTMLTKTEGLTQRLCVSHMAVNCADEAEASVDQADAKARQLTTVGS